MCSVLRVRLLTITPQSVPYTVCRDRSQSKGPEYFREQRRLALVSAEEGGLTEGGVDTGVCEINTHLDVARVLKIPTPLA